MSFFRVKTEYTAEELDTFDRGYRARLGGQERDESKPDLWLNGWDYADARGGDKPIVTDEERRREEEARRRREEVYHERLHRR